MDTRRLDAGDQEAEEPGWQDTDSEGMVNDWQLEGMDAEGEEQQQQQQQQQEQEHEMLLPVPLLTAAVQQVHHDIIDLTDLRDNAQDVQGAAEPLHHPPQHHTADAIPGAAAAAEAAQQRPLHRHIAALINRRVRALLHRAMHEATTAEDAAALQTLLQHTVELAAGAGGAGSSSSGSSSSSNVGSNYTDGMEGEADEPAEGCTTRFDPNLTASHQYLGDVDELEGTYGLLPESTSARLPLLLLDGVVLFPGCQLPLLLSSSAEQHLLERALAAPPPFTRLLAVLPGPRSWMHSMHRLVACTAEVRQLRRQSDAAGQQMAVLALGRQRAEVVQEQLMGRSQSSVLVRILGEGCQTDVPQPLRCYAAAIHPALAAPWDLQLLVGRVRQLIQLVLMPVASFQGTPLELSYWISHNLPLQPSTRQLLLTASGPAERLRLLLGLLERLDQLECSECRGLLATTADVLAMTSEGIAGTFVNSHGYVHEMVTFRRVRHVSLEGHPETAHSWFPGYAWTIAYCGGCGQHLGWRFTAVAPGLSPRVFWGLRRQVLTCSTRTAATGGQGARQGGGEVHGVGGGGLAAEGVVAIPLGDVPVAAAEAAAEQPESDDPDDTDEDDDDEDDAE